MLGFSGTNMRYVTITKSQFFNNGIGIVPNALDSEKFAPAEDNVIRDNDIFWNNFNYYEGAPFKIPSATATSALYPVGIGVLLFGGRRNTVEDNRDLRQLPRRRRRARAASCSSRRTRRRRPRRQRGARQRVRPGRRPTSTAATSFYDGNGTGNCFGGNTGVAVDVPGRRLDVRGVPVHRRQRVQRRRVQSEMAGAGGQGGVAKWIKHPHAPKARLRAARALHAVTAAGSCRPPRRRRRAAGRGAGGGRRPQAQVGRGGRQLLPARQAHREARARRSRGSGPTTWRSTSTTSSSSRARRASRRFQSEPASSGYRYKRTLTKPGRYKVICTLHEEMTMTITVKRAD